MLSSCSSVEHQFPLLEGALSAAVSDVLNRDPIPGDPVRAVAHTLLRQHQSITSLSPPRTTTPGALRNATDAEAQAVAAGVFNVLDKDSSGTLSADELIEALTSGEVGATKSEALRVVDACDVDGDGQISLDELVVAWGQRSDLVGLLRKASAQKAKRGEWTAEKWLQGIDLPSCVACSLLEGREDERQLDAMRALGALSEADLVGKLLDGGVIERMAALLKPKLDELAVCSMVTNAEVQNKFAGQIELSYEGLDTFYGGLEARIGAPQPNVFAAMEGEHVHGVDSQAPFETGNYGVVTTTETEWLYVVAPEESDSLSHLNRREWPTETAKKLPDRSRCRQRRPLSHYIAESEVINARLALTRQPPLIKEEVVAARLYTGPLFEKYNAVLRGLHSDSPFLRGQLVKRCAPTALWERYEAATKAKKADAWEEGLAGCNTYTTTLHSINSAIVKCGKLGKATTVYRGISGMALPKSFWQENEFGFMGGVENGFMSTTTVRDVATGYASGGDMGIVFCIQQGMIDRGADISWVSQYPHEREILFGPLTGLEVVGSSIDGGIVMLHMRSSVNLNAMTLEQVISKKRKVLLDTGTAMRIEVGDALRARVDGHYDSAGEPINCHWSKLSPISGDRYVEEVDGFSLCKAEYEKLPAGKGTGSRLGGIGLAPFKPGKADFALDNSTVVRWSTLPEEMAERGKLTASLVNAVAMAHSAEWFNSDHNFQLSLNVAIRIKGQMLASTPERIELEGTELLARLPVELGSSKTLQILRISLPSPSTLPALDDALRASETLTELDLSRNGLGPTQGAAIAAAVRASHSLKKVNLSGNQLAMGSRSEPLSWGDHGVKIDISDDGRVATDVAADPLTGDGAAGRYRTALGSVGFSTGTHKISFRVLSRGRTNIGMATSKAQGSWSENRPMALYQSADAWTLCPQPGGVTNMWHHAKQSNSGLTPVAVGGMITVVLDCDARTLTFLVDGAGSDSGTHVYTDLPKGETFFPAVAFGGDSVTGASIELSDYSSVVVDISAVQAIADALSASSSVTEIDFTDNQLPNAAQSVLTTAATPRAVSLLF